MEIKINDLRSLDFQDFYQIKPLNVVIGANSSGKSSFLRFFPLIKQSIEKLTSSPILWYGPYVDFGSFDESLNRKSDDGLIKISFRHKIPNKHINFFMRNNRFLVNRYFIDLRKRLINKDLEFSYNLCLYKDKINKISIGFLDNLIEIENTEDGCQIRTNNQIIFSKEMVSLEANTNLKNLINFDISIKSSYLKNLDVSLPTDKISTAIFLAHELLVNELKKVAHKRTQVGNLSRIADDLLRLNVFSIKDEVKNLIGNLDYTQLRRIVDEVEFVECYKTICCILLTSRINGFVDLINYAINDYFSNVDYIAPLRANGERYYRYQNLSIEAIDPSGENIPTLINSLNQYEIDSLNEWLKTHFNFRIFNEKHKGHNSISISDERTGSVTNIKDTGFGFSQIIPILIQLWMYTREEDSSEDKIDEFGFWVYGEDNNISNTRRKTFIVEQPELHLHPALQARLVDTICEMIKYSKKNNIDINFLLETHSETIVNRVYYNFLQGRIENDIVNISIFSQDSNGITRIDKATIEANGKIENWPYGFFLPEV